MNLFIARKAFCSQMYNKLLLLDNSQKTPLIILLRTTRWGKGKPFICQIVGILGMAVSVYGREQPSHLRTFDVRKSSTHVLTPPKIGALGEVAPDNIYGHLPGTSFFKGDVKAPSRAFCPAAEDHSLATLLYCMWTVP